MTQAEKNAETIRRLASEVEFPYKGYTIVRNECTWSAFVSDGTRIGNYRTEFEAKCAAIEDRLNVTLN